MESDKLLEEPQEAAVPYDDNSEFRDLARQLIQAVEQADEDDSANGEDVIPSIPSIRIPPLPRPLNRQTTVIVCTPSRPILLKTFFDYPDVAGVISGTHLEFYWKGGLKNLECELAAYDLLYEDEDESSAPPSDDPQIVSSGSGVDDVSGSI
jgi:hypothetical protein